RDLQSGELIVDESMAKKRGYTVGQTLTMEGARGTRKVTVVGIYAKNKIASGPIISSADATALFRSPLAQQGYVQVGDAGQVSAVKQQFDNMVDAHPQVTL